jgi:hypothetical protein
MPMIIEFGEVGDTLVPQAEAQEEAKLQEPKIEVATKEEVVETNQPVELLDGAL